MTAQFTGSDAELNDLVDAVGDEVDRQWRDNATFRQLDTAPFRAWRDAAVARYLAEAGAVHPKVHTPGRVMQWLSGQGWQAVAPTDPTRALADWIDAEHDTVVSVCLHADDVNYAGYADLAIASAAGAADLTVPEALLEIAQMPDEVIW